MLRLAPVIETEEVQVLRDFHKDQLSDGLEGAVIKKVDGEYHLKESDLLIWQDPELSTRKATADKKAKAAAQKTEPDPAAKVSAKKKSK